MLPVSTTEKYKAVLNEHAEIENPPTFLFPCLNGRQQREVMAFRDGMGQGTTDGFDELFAFIESYLVGWENIDVEYEKGKLLDVVGYGQCMELLALIAYQGPSVADKKKSKLQSQESTEKSAPDVKEKASAKESSTSITDSDSQG